MQRIMCADQGMLHMRTQHSAGHLQQHLLTLGTPATATSSPPGATSAQEETITTLHARLCSTMWGETTTRGFYLCWMYLLRGLVKAPACTYMPPSMSISCFAPLRRVAPVWRPRSRQRCGSSSTAATRLLDTTPSSATSQQAAMVGPSSEGSGRTAGGGQLRVLPCGLVPAVITDPPFLLSFWPHGGSHTSVPTSPSPCADRPVTSSNKIQAQTAQLLCT